MTPPTTTTQPQPAPPAPPPAPPAGRLRVFSQESPSHSPWPLRVRLRFALWRVAAAVLFRPTPKPMYRFRAVLLRLFGGRIAPKAFVAASCRVRIPWNLVMEPYSCLGEETEVYNLGPVVLRERATVAQHVYLCAGTHDFADPRLPLVVGPITIGAHAFVGVRALVLPGVDVGEGAVVGAGAVVTKDVPPWTIAAGNPCRPIRRREMRGGTDGSAAAAGAGAVKGVSPPAAGDSA